MNFCSNCGHQLAGAVSCTSCGAVVPQASGSPAPTAPPPSAPPAPPTAPAGGAGSGGAVTVDVQRFLRPLLVGNWVGAAFVAGATLMVAGLVSLVLALLIKPDGFGLDNTLTLTATLMTAAFGADLLVTPPGDMDLDAVGYAGAFPLTITLCALGVAVILFRRITATYASAFVAAGDALRAAVVTGVLAALVAAIFRADNDALGAGLDSFEAGENEQLIQWGTSIAGSLFMPIVMVTCVLTLSCVMRRDWLHPRLQLIHDIVAAPLSGLTGLVLLLPVAGALCVAVVVLFGDGVQTSELTSDEWMTLIGFSLAYLANLGFGLIGLGAGVSLGVNGEGSYAGGGDSGTERFSEMHRLTWWTGEGDEPGLWIALGVMPLWLLAGAFLVARATRSRTRLVRNLVTWAGSFLIFIPLLVRLSGVHAGAEANLENGEEPVELSGLYIGGEFDGSLYAGLSGVAATLLLLVFAFVAALAVSAATGTLDMKQVAAQARSLAASVQTQPGTRQPTADSPAPPHAPPTPASTPTTPPPAPRE